LLVLTGATGRNPSQDENVEDEDEK
jgi:hypothetical protein